MNVALPGKRPLALLPAWAGAIEDRKMLGFEARSAFERHRPADILIGRLDLGLREAERREEIEAGRIHSIQGQFQNAGAEILAQRPFVKDELDVKGAGE